MKIFLMKAGLGIYSGIGKKKICFVTLCSKISFPKSVGSGELQTVINIVTDNKI